MLRPRAARWFEVLCPRSDSAHVVGILAQTGSVEIEVRTPDRDEPRLQELSEGLGAYRALLSRYQRYWVRGHLSHSADGVPPRDLLDRALERIESWGRKADPVIEHLQILEEELSRLHICRRVVTALQASDLDFSLLNEIGPFQDRVAAILPDDATMPELSDATLHLKVPLQQEWYLLAVGPVEDMVGLRERVKAAKGRKVSPPEWLEGKPTQALAQLNARLIKLEARIARRYRQLDRLFEEFRLAESLGDLTTLEWFVGRVGVLELASEQFAWVTGWTDDWSGDTLRKALELECGRSLIRFPSPPPEAEPPQILYNARWIQPFEVFARALGIPGGSEADPSPLLALLVPLLFGYMFGDVGHGLVLFTAGWLLRQRFPLARLLMAGGISSTLFGLVFGSLFCNEHLLPPLWLHPLEEPVTVLAVPLVFAVLLLCLGQVLNGLEAAWRGELRKWLWTDAGILLIYLASAGALLLPQLLWAALAGLVWYLLGSARLEGPLHALAAAGELLERGLQLFVNTLSFARVGAFALAHAGLGSAVISLADATGSALGATLILILGNLVIILLEGLVVSIQTTRLVLFEFFTRFLHGQGRVFRPLQPPPAIVQGENR